MNGFGLLKGLTVTLKHFMVTYLEDLKKIGKPYLPQGSAARKSNSKTRGIFTVQYPEEKLILSEEFRFVPILIYDLGPSGEKVDRCTACGICAKVCPPQCIWITRANDSNTGRPIASADKFSIDIDICMNCGFCAEFCPFDAIKMDHDFEISTTERLANNIYDKAKLSKSVSYYASIRPVNYAKEETARLEKEARLTKKPVNYPENN